MIFEADGVEGEVFFLAASRVGIDLNFNQLLDRVNAVAHNAGDFALVGGNHFAADDQQAVLVAQNMALDQHIAAFGFCQVVGRFNFGLGAQLE